MFSTAEECALYNTTAEFMTFHTIYTLETRISGLYQYAPAGASDGRTGGGCGKVEGKCREREEL